MINLIPEIMVFVIILILFIYNWMISKFSFWKKLGVVHKKPNLIFGHIGDVLLMKKQPGILFREFYHEYSGARFIGVYQMTKPNLMVVRPEDIRRVLVTDFQHFKDRTHFTASESEPLLMHLFNVRAQQWKPMRQAVSPAFTVGKLKNMVPLIVEVGDTLTEYLNELCEHGNDVEFREVMAKFTTDVIGSIGFGIQMNSIKDSESLSRKMGRLIFDSSSSTFLKRFVRSNFPKLYTRLKLSVHRKEVEDFLMGVVREAVSERIRTGNKRHDFIDLMLELKNKENPGAVVDDIFMASQAYVFFAAGFETSSSLMSFVLHELAMNPGVQNKVYEEIKALLSENGGKVTHELVGKMKYLHMVLNEAMRKYPALTILQRTCTSQYTFPNSEVTLQPGIGVSIPVLALHYDPKYYPDPEKFIPERFTADAKKERNPMVFLPFGEGPRNCVGLRLGTTQSIIGLITVLKDFSVEPCSKTMQKVELNPKSLVTASKHGIWLKLKRRKKS